MNLPFHRPTPVGTLDNSQADVSARLGDHPIRAVTYSPENALRNAMSIDVEDYFQVSAMETTVARKDWESMECRVEANVDKLLALFADSGIKATFFTLAWVAKRYPQVVARIVEQGHELASHGLEHRRITSQNREQFQRDVVQTKQILEDIGQVEIKGYRAASYSINRNNLWALEVLAESGHRYSSSIAPVRHDLYGIPDAPRWPFIFEDGPILEVPISTVRLMGRNQACGGGGWFRLFPLAFTQWAYRRLNQRERLSGVFYLHPWELDPEQPRVPGLPAKSRFRHYLNLEKTEERLRQLIDSFEWDRMDRVFLEPLQ